MTEREIEAVARALVQVRNLDPDELMWEKTVPQLAPPAHDEKRLPRWRWFLADARAAILALDLCRQESRGAQGAHMLSELSGLARRGDS